MEVEGGWPGVCLVRGTRWL